MLFVPDKLLPLPLDTVGKFVVYAIVPAISEGSIKFLIEQMVIQKLNEEVSQVNPILEEYDFVYGTVKPEVSSDEYLPPDKKIVDLISNSKREKADLLSKEESIELKILSYLSKTPIREAELAEKIGISTMALRNRISPLIKTLTPLTIGNIQFPNSYIKPDFSI